MIISPKRLSFPPLVADELKKSGLKLCITGASGWVGMTLLEMCESCLGNDFDQRVFAFASRPGQVGLRSGRQVKLHDLKELPEIVEDKWILCHLAFVGKEKIAELGEGAFVEANEIIRKHVERAIDKCRPTAIFYSSSGAVYNQNNVYAKLKAVDERYFAGLGIKCIMPRIFNISGPYLNKPQVFALSSLILQGWENKALHILAKHQVIRSYVSVSDILNDVFERLFSGRGTEMYDAAGSEVVEMRELAEIVNEVMFDNQLPIIREGFDPDLKADRYVGKAEIKETSDLRQQIMDTADFLNSIS